MDENISPWRSCDIRKLGRWSPPLKAIPQKSITRRSGFVAVTPRAKFIVYARKVEIIVRNLFKCNKIRGTTGSSGSASGSVGIMLLRARARSSIIPTLPLADPDEPVVPLILLHLNKLRTIISTLRA